MSIKATTNMVALLTNVYFANFERISREIKCVFLSVTQPLLQPFKQILFILLLQLLLPMSEFWTTSEVDNIRNE